MTSRHASNRRPPITIRRAVTATVIGAGIALGLLIGAAIILAWIIIILAVIVG